MEMNIYNSSNDGETTEPGGADSMSCADHEGWRTLYGDDKQAAGPKVS